MSPVGTYSNINCEFKISNHESTEAIKNKTLPNDDIGKGDRKKVIILEDTLLTTTFKWEKENPYAISPNSNVEVYTCLNNTIRPFTWYYFKQKNNPYNLRNTQLLKLSKCRTKTYELNTTLLKGALCGINCQIILRKQNPLYISKIKFRNGQGGHVLVVSALKLSTFKKCTYVKGFFKICCNIFIFLAIIINISIIIYFFLNLFI